MPSAKKVNLWSKKEKGIGHDSINHLICVRYRVKQYGLELDCPECHGKGHQFTSNNCKLGIQLWMLHPRKGCSRGVIVDDIKQDELPEVYKWLQKANQRNIDRFYKILNK